tara:strand:- start:318 stop:638 length:321 start_codon:yes stop_codon:yes gene_type:complete
MLVEMNLKQAEYLINKVDENKKLFHRSFGVEELLSAFRRAIKKEADDHSRSIDKVIEQMETSTTIDIMVLSSLKDHKEKIEARSNTVTDKYFDRDTGREKDEIGGK